MSTEAGYHLIVAVQDMWWPARHARTVHDHNLNKPDDRIRAPSNPVLSGTLLYHLDPCHLDGMLFHQDFY